jgi:hypothetical protein
MPGGFWSSRRLIWIGAAWLSVAVALCWAHGWSSPAAGVTTVTGSIIYWFAYSGVTALILVFLLTGLFYVGRTIVRGARKLFSR